MSIQIQHKIRQNALEMREYLTQLHDWEQEMELKEKTKASLRKSQQVKNQEANVEIRKPKETQQKQKQQDKKPQKKVDLVRDANTVAAYYNAWSKYDVDKEIQALEEEESKKYKPYNPYQDSKNNLRAKPKTKVNITGRRLIVSDPTELKDKGNLHFQSLQFEKAIDCYTECLKKLDEQNIEFQNLSEDKKKLRCIVLSNRSMAYLKTRQTVKALNDANQSLKYNPQYSKSYYRRAECLKKLGKYKDSLKDFRMVKALQPNQSKADSQIKKIQAFLAKRAKETKQSLIIEYNQNLMNGSKRIEISEVAQFQQQQKKQQKNYLQEL